MFYDVNAIILLVGHDFFFFPRIVDTNARNNTNADFLAFKIHDSVAGIEKSVRCALTGFRQSAEQFTFVV